jgi:hypothetical protein
MDDKDALDEDGWEKRDEIWERFLFSLVLLILFAVAQNLVWVVAVLQFFWMLFYKRPNLAVAEFGARLGVWLKRTAMYLSGATDEKPFPWREID